jgi:hypothetical protein
MLAQLLVRVCIATSLLAWAAAATAEDFSKYDNERELYKVVRAIPASDKSANAEGYARLLALNPNKELYWAKYERYSGSSEAGLYAIVKAIPASNSAANATGYARLLALDPNNTLYRAKFKRYSGKSGRPASVHSISEFRSFLAGSWCVVDDHPTYIAGPHVQKLVILADGNYSLYSKPVSSMSWTSPKEKGKLAFGESRNPQTGDKFFFAESREFGTPRLVVDNNDHRVFWSDAMNDFGQAGRDSCSKFE